MNEPVIEIRDLARAFRRKRALDGVSLSVPRGCVYGLVGENGAGKTTLIKHVMGALVAKSGSVRVFGLDPVKDCVAVLARIGYLSEDRAMPGWMRVREIMRYTQAFFPDWDEAYAEELRATFGLDPEAKIRTLSRGEMAQTGLLLALAHRPELLVLDEPSSGLDAVVRRDILSAIIRTVADEGRTVFFSSHLLDEVERVSDRVAMIIGGRVVLDGEMESITGSHRKLIVHFDEPRATPPAVASALHVEGTGKEWSVTCDGHLDAARSEIASIGGTIIEERAVSLEDVFVARSGRANRGA